MTQKILIIEEGSTRRMMISAELRAAGYETLACASVEEAWPVLRQEPLFLIAASQAAMGDSQFPRLARWAQDSRRLNQIIALLDDASPSRRLEALHLGATAICQRPVHSGIFLALVRAAARHCSAQQDRLPQRSALTHLGFAEEAQPLHGAPQGQIMLLSTDATLEGPLNALTRARVCRAEPGPRPRSPDGIGEADVIVLDQRGASAEALATLRPLLADLRAKDSTRGLMQLLVFDAGQEEACATALDLGADDTICGAASAAEIAHRAGRLMRRKLAAERFDRDVLHGLRAAVTDPLTGLANRRMALPALARLSTRADLTAVMVIDIDHFKSVNDQHGHPAGDDILRAFAARLREACTDQDLVARFGGEEFLIARSGLTAPEAQVLADSLRNSIAARPYSSAHIAQPVPLTASIGLALCRGPLTSTAATEALLAEADRALYRSKGSGRNCVTLSQPAA